MITVQDNYILNNMTSAEILGLAITVSFATVANVVIAFKAWVTIQKKVTQNETQIEFQKERIKEMNERIDSKVDKAFMNEFKSDFLASIEEIKQLIGKVEERLYEHTHDKK